MAQMLNLVQETMKEAGCIRYDLHQDLKNEGHFLFYETWETRADWKMHLNSQHIVHFVKNTEKMVLKFEVFEMMKL